MIFSYSFYILTSFVSLYFCLIHFRPGKRYLTSFGFTPAMIIARTLTLILHFTTAAIQVGFHKEAELDNDPGLSKIGYYSAVVVHSFWNLGAILVEISFGPLV